MGRSILVRGFGLSTVAAEKLATMPAFGDKANTTGMRIGFVISEASLVLNLYPLPICLWVMAGTRIIDSAPKGETPGDLASVRVKGEVKWLTTIQNSKRKSA